MFKKIIITLMMLPTNIHKAMSKYNYEILEDDKTYYGKIPGFDGSTINISSVA